MSRPIVSIIIPVFNGRRVIGAILDDTLSQSMSDIEVIVVDDGSSDGTEELLHEYKIADERVVIVSQKNTGPSAARNRGIDLARGDYVMFFDADDRTRTDTVEKMYQPMEGNHTIDLVEAGCNINRVDRRGGKTQTVYPLEKTQDNDDVVYVLKSLLRNGLFHSLWNKIYRLSVIQHHDIRFKDDIRNGEDLIFNLEYVSFAREYQVLQEAFYTYRREESSYSITNRKNAASSIFSNRRKMFRALTFYANGRHRTLTYLVGIRWFISSVMTLVRSRGIL